MASITRNTIYQSWKRKQSPAANWKCTGWFLPLLTTGGKDLISGPNVLVTLTLSSNLALAFCRPLDTGAKFHNKEEGIFLEIGSLEKNLSCLAAVGRSWMPAGCRWSIQRYTPAQKTITAPVPEHSHLMRESKWESWRSLGWQAQLMIFPLPRMSP